MGSKYKAIAVIFISINAMLLITLIAAGMIKEGRKGEAKEPEETEHFVEVERTQVSGLSLEDVGEEVKEERNEEGYLSSENMILLSSVGQDILIRIMDMGGQAASGKDWQASVKDGEGNESLYYDDDMDGSIYIDKVKPGKYEVSVGGVGSSSISVRNNIKLTALNDIRKIMVEESSIDASKEDTSVNEEAEQETEAASNSDYDLAGGSIGIDVSKYQKEIDWQKVKEAGIEYAIIRAGYRGSATGVLVKDPYFDRNIIGAKEAGIKLGVYFFTQAINSQEAAEEALAVTALIGADELTLPVYMDVEGSGSVNGRADGLDITVRTENIRVFCETLNELGYKAGVYANKNWLTNKIDTSALEDYDIWLAQYKVREPTYEGRYSIWQYTSKGQVNGITGPVDMDLIVGR